ncbi:MAG: decarboxylating NADP(+)-dependent phosphogluconate dehydrogenase [Fibrobacter sp.]|nr:decarboxylating NADP(+)-dependent phosphogluconate dehydrogenase [Fibrobacter sp.]
MEPKGDIGVIGLAVMGSNLVLNMSDNGFDVIVFNRTASKTHDFINGAANGRSNIIPAYTIEEFIKNLKRPRKIMLMVKAGIAVDQFIDKLLPYLENGDLIIDGGNSYFKDSVNRAEYLEKKGVMFIGVGISGGELGARHGPSIMPGGTKTAWPLIEKIFRSICAKTADGTPCCDWVGPDGSGHYVKMVHNGIEYGDMQIISEAYHILRSAMGMSTDEIADIFKLWNDTELNSYLVEITSDILRCRDSDGSPLVDKILDTAGQKGTGRWSIQSASELGVPVTLITEAVFSRMLSSFKEQRVSASEILPGPSKKINSIEIVPEDVQKALLASKIISYTQGFMLMHAASLEYNWDLKYGNVALLWREGCIIRSTFLDYIKNGFELNPELSNLLMDEYFCDLISKCLDSWRIVVAFAVQTGIAVPAFSSALAFYDGYRSKNLPANLIQAQRDYFGSHMYERVDQPRGKFFHTNWIENP